VLQINRLNDPEMTRKRTKLSLPAPQVTDAELQEIVKLGYSGDSAGDDGASATNMLTGNYAQSAMPTPMRTPRAEARGGDTILQDALDLKALQETVTPLKVRWRPAHHPCRTGGWLIVHLPHWPRPRPAPRGVGIVLAE
jgi:pre-mRNA-splicing factor CDC5/CEF1